MTLQATAETLTWRGPGLACELTPERALWWSDTQTMFIADPHFGKAEVFRLGGHPVPHGTTEQTLGGLDKALRRYPVKRLVVLGDFMHARRSHHPNVLGALHAWRARHAHVDCVLVRGNHDDHAGDPPDSLGFEIVDEPWLLDGVACCHIPPTALPPGARYALAGHIHPVVVLHGKGRDRVRLPCFDMGPAVGILPAFGAFTGGWTVPVRAGHTLGIVAEDSVLALQP